MSLKSISKPVAVVGAGSFGTAIANLLCENSSEVILYVRDPEKAKNIAKTRISSGQDLSPNIEVTNDLKMVGDRCNVIFPVVPSANFRGMMQQLAPHLKPYHILIHGTKGFDLITPEKPFSSRNPMSRKHVRTMSEVIKEESSVVRIGCMAGPNLAREIAEHKPAATVIASQFDEVVEVGQRLLKNDRFMIYGGGDILGAELCGVLKNIIAVGAGMINGLGLGENARALLISRGLVEMIYIGRSLGADIQSFLGLAGVGDLIATCGSSLSRNYTVGHKLAGGMKLDAIIASMDEVAEGVKTIDIVYSLSRTYKVRSVICEMLYKIIHERLTPQDAQLLLMKLPFRQEIDFLDNHERNSY